MSTNNTTEASGKVTKYVTLRIPKELGFKLRLRARVVLTRLARVGPVSAKKLAEDHLGGLLRRERGLAEALVELQQCGLAKHDRDGWSAVEPSGKVRGGFRWLKEGTGPWANRYQYTKVPLPKRPPWRRSNALELWCVYWTIREVRKSRVKLTLGKICRALGIMRKTARRAIQNLAAMGHVVCAGNKIESLKVTDLKITDQYLTYEGRDDSEAEDETPLAAALRQLGIRDPEAIIEEGEATRLLGSDLIDFAKRLHKKHDAGKWGPDPSRFILAALRDRRNHRARGGNR